MEKLRNFAKKPLAIISGALFGVFLIMLIVVCDVPHGKTYSAETTITQNQMQGNIRITLDLSDKATFKMEYLSGDLFEGMDDEYRVMSISGEYKIENGELLIKFDGKSEFENVGKINSFKIIQNEENPILESDNVTLECTTNKALLIVSVVCMVVFAVLIVLSLILLQKDKKQALVNQTAKVENDTTEVTEETKD